MVVYNLGFLLFPSHKVPDQPILIAEIQAALPNQEIFSF